MACISSRSLPPAGVGVTPKQPSTALLDARWCIHGQMPQMRLTIRGSSLAGLPSTNFSNPRIDRMLTRAWFTLPGSSSSMPMEACPSMRVMGWIWITRDMVYDSFL